MTNLFRYLKESESLEYCDTGQWKKVVLQPAFPMTEPEAFLIVLDLSSKKELKLIDDIEELDERSKESVRSYLENQNFSFEVLEILSIKEKNNLRFYDVKTQFGHRLVHTEVEEWPEKSHRGASLYQIRDVFGDVYFFDWDRMNTKNKKRLAHLVS